MTRRHLAPDRGPEEHRGGTTHRSRDQESRLRQAGLMAFNLPVRGSAAAAFALLFFPHGGQRVARENAQVAMAVDRRRARERRDAAESIEHLAVAGVVVAPGGKRSEGSAGG